MGKQYELVKRRAFYWVPDVRHVIDIDLQNNISDCSIFLDGLHHITSLCSLLNFHVLFDKLSLFHLLTWRSALEE